MVIPDSKGYTFSEHQYPKILIGTIAIYISISDAHLPAPNDQS